MNKLGWMRRAKVLVAAVAVGGVPLITVGSCDPITGAFDFYRDDDFDDGYYHDDFFYYDDFYYDDCFDCYYDEEIIFFP